MCICCNRGVGDADPVSQAAAAATTKQEIAGGPTNSSGRIRRAARLRLAHGKNAQRADAPQLGHDPSGAGDRCPGARRKDR